jgi:hypothetical protein
MKLPMKQPQNAPPAIMLRGKNRAGIRANPQQDSDAFAIGTDRLAKCPKRHGQADGFSCALGISSTGFCLFLQGLSVFESIRQGLTVR